MELFSERHGLGPRKILQLDEVDAGLRNRLWNGLTRFCWDFFRKRYTDTLTLVRNLWTYHLNWLLDDYDFETAVASIKQYFYDCAWYQVYDFLEFVVAEFPDDVGKMLFISDCNDALEGELAAYRFVGNRIVPTTSETEIAEVEKALDTPFKPVRIHLQTALDLLAHKESPDYRNCIKEAISAVEAVCNVIEGGKKARTLKSALGAIERAGKMRLHPALKEAFIKLYGWTSDADGIRHCLMDEPDLGVEDALFMLVACSAFVNYLTAKSVQPLELL